ncbi:hypothetical protein CHS0354_004810 [Potamilus streckersoni]|uniref:Uncharacterized protein n=1 Tax=Potamilus streckersoni TaxID=2493646 RepID=A0AAE0S8T5_9BIVA|nr:hypothetical protein CHS0354_004810 [Potamilus streckersoni]
MTCSNGTHTRDRQCIFLPDRPHGHNCTGMSHEIQTCNEGLCPASTNSSFTCATCGDNPADLCEILFEPITNCPDPYCINRVRNSDSGQRLVERKCGSLQECIDDWWQRTSQYETCTLFNENFMYTQRFFFRYGDITPKITITKENGQQDSFIGWTMEIIVMMVNLHDYMRWWTVQSDKSMHMLFPIFPCLPMVRLAAEIRQRQRSATTTPVLWMDYGILGMNGQTARLLAEMDIRHGQDIASTRPNFLMVQLAVEIHQKQRSATATSVLVFIVIKSKTVQ